MEPLRLVIDGKKVPTKHCFEVLNPATEKVAGLAPLAGEKELQDAIRAAKVAFPTWRDETERKRQTACRKIAEKIEQHAEEQREGLFGEQSIRLRHPRDGKRRERRRLVRLGRHARSKSPAAPWPPPMHIVTMA